LRCLHHSFHHTKFDLSDTLPISHHFEEKPRQNSMHALLVNPTSPTPLLLSVCHQLGIPREYRLSRLSGSRMGPPVAVRPASSDCLLRMERGVRGNDMGS
jgi:hypothetical protein